MREKLIRRWQELELEYSGSPLRFIDYDKYTIDDLKEEVETLEYCLQQQDDFERYNIYTR